MTTTGSTGFFLGLKHPARRRSFGAAVVGPPGKFFEAVVAASAFVELYDEELEFEPWRRGIVTECVAAGGLGRRLEAFEADGVFPCLIGYPALPPDRSGNESLDTILFAPSPAGGDLLEKGSLLVGHRAGALPRGRKTPRVLTAREISRGRKKKFTGPARRRRVLLVIDPHVLDPSLLPVKGNLEPGGLQWHPLISLLRDIFAGERVAAALILPCALRRTDPGPSFILARLAAKMIAFALAGR